MNFVFDSVSHFKFQVMQTLSIFRSQNFFKCIFFGLLFSVFFQSKAQQVVTEDVATETHEGVTFKIVKVVKGLNHPWAVNWLPDG